MVSSKARAASFSRAIWAVLVGVDRVPSDWLSPMMSPERDALELAAQLCNPLGCAVPQEQVTCLTGSSASRERIIDSLKAAAARVTNEDIVFIYFAGHGGSDSRGFRLFASDSG